MDTYIHIHTHIVIIIIVVVCMFIVLTITIMGGSVVERRGRRLALAPCAHLQRAFHCPGRLRALNDIDSSKISSANSQKSDSIDTMYAYVYIHIYIYIHVYMHIIPS